MIQNDNGKEFVWHSLDARHHRGDPWRDFGHPGRSTDKSQMESANARLRAQCLSANVLELLEDAENLD